MSLENVLTTSGILVVCGSGGVGKTTMSASLAIRAAQLGRKVAVCTIDPARRLADSLGIDMEQTDLVVVKDAGICDGVDSGGEMTALMLDTKRTFDFLVEKYAPSPEMCEQIFANSLYQRISSQVSGTQEYMALEKLYELHTTGQYDLIILDTPPTRHALDFLTAPERMARVLDSSSLQWILNPSSSASKFSFKLIKHGFRKVAGKLDEVFGMKVFKDLIEFFRAFDGMYDGFKQRSSAVKELLQSEKASFIVATSPEQNPLHEAAFLMSQLNNYEMPLRALIVNRYHHSVAAEEQRVLAQERANPTTAAGRCFQALLAYDDLGRADRQRTREALAEHSEKLDYYWVPRFSHDVSDLDGLRRVSSRMMPGDKHGPH
jgi:anion-transporting  ArsA/GET3 family ATPase